MPTRGTSGYNLAPILDALMVACGLAWIVIFVLDSSSRVDVMPRSMHADLMIAFIGVSSCAAIARAALYVRRGQMADRAEFVAMLRGEPQPQVESEEYARGYLDAAEALGGPLPAEAKGRLTAVRRGRLG